MNILVVSKLVPNGLDSQRTVYVWPIALALAAIQPLRVVGPIPWAPPVPGVARWRRLRAVPPRETLDGLEVFHPRYLIVPRTARSLQGWSYGRALERVVQSMKPRFAPDVIFATWAYPDVYAAVRVGRVLGIPVVGKVTGSDVNVLPSLGLGKRIREALRGADRIVAVSEDLRAKAIDLGARPERAVVVENGLDLERFRVGDRQEARARLGLAMDDAWVVTVGNVERVKGPDILMEAFVTLSARRPGVRLAMVGDGSMLEPIKGIARNAGIADRVEFAGRRAPEELPLWYAASDVIALGSRSEGLPNVVREALACGRPVVAPRVGGIAELLREGVAGRLVPPENPAALAEALDLTLAEPPDAETVRATLRTGSWQDAARRMVAVLEEAVRERPRLPEPTS